jgi:iron(III) transport system permease protein
MSRPQNRPSTLGVVHGIATLAERLSSWRAQRRASPAWTLVVAAIVAVMLLPVATILVLAFGAEAGALTHLRSTVLAATLHDTAVVLLGVGTFTLLVGTVTAWLVTMYRFPLHGLIDRLLVLPLAVPTYIVAYAYAELLDYSGPIQSALRQLFAFKSARDYWFPDIRTLPGAIFVLSSVLYPYVYLAARASFMQQSVCALEVARTLGRTEFGAFRSVALPLARPALVAGAALALMECLNDLGAMQYLGIQTLSASIYATWLQRSNLGGAAQIAAILLCIVALLFAAERWARGGSRFHHTTGRYQAIPFALLEGPRAWAATAVCLLPFVLGFLLPMLILAGNAWRHAEVALAGGFWRAAGNSLLLSALAAMAAVACGLALAYARRVAANGFTRPAVRVAGLGYALPGTVLALGLLIPLAGLDNRIDAVFRATFGISTGLLISGTVIALLLAYTVRFLAVSLGTIEAGLERVSPNLDAAARTLGETALSALWRVHLPLLLPALGTAALLVFVDTMKELPATLLLRPFNFETLATHVYGFAALEQLEAASVGALAIVAVGLLPVLLLHRAIAEGRAGS